MGKINDSRSARAYAEQVAAHRGWVVNPESSLTDTIVDGLATQTRRFGKPYCPCRDIDGNEGDQDVICPCAYASADIGQSGQCFCGLFLALGKDPSTVGSIPERRP